MAEPTYTIDYPCSVCGHVSHFTGVRPLMVEEKVVIPLHCLKCQASGAYTMYRHDLIGQPDYIPPEEREAKFAATMVALKAKWAEAMITNLRNALAETTEIAWELSALHQGEEDRFDSLEARDLAYRLGAIDDFSWQEFPDPVEVPRG